ncbi:MAG: hypothetical protein IT370_37670 [Deltaproteobacteria bacterium]|nr:hypothetical protein [Deltaproteobacteria bacterium]
MVVAVVVAGIGLVLASASARAGAGRAPRPKLVVGKQGSVMSLDSDATRLVWTSEEGVFVASQLGKGKRKLSAEEAMAVSLDGDAVLVARRGVVERIVLASAAVTQLASPRFAIAIAADSSHVYWSGGVAGVIERVARTGGTPEPVAKVPEAGIGEIALDGSHLYFVVLRKLGEDGALARVPLSGGAVEVLYTGGRVQGLALGEGQVFCTVDGGSEGDGKVVRVAKVGGKPETIADGLTSPWALAAVPDGVVVLAQGKVGKRAGKLLHLRDGAAPVVLADGQAVPWALTTTAAQVYWSSWGDRTIKATTLTRRP